MVIITTMGNTMVTTTIMAITTTAIASVFAMVIFTGTSAMPTATGIGTTFASGSDVIRRPRPHVVAGAAMLPRVRWMPL